MFSRCHNRSHLLADPKIKTLYMSCTKKALKHKSVDNSISISAFCIMSNHSHMKVEYQAGSALFSNFMRVSNGSFGQKYNHVHGTSGKVANDRPKTPLIENPEHQMRVHFYIEANPIKAKIITVEGLKFYKYSSYGFYAYGIKTEFTDMLTIPQWYIDLGKTMKERQKKFRKLFLEYLESNITIDYISKPFIGSPSWVDERYTSMKKEVAKRCDSPP